MFAITVNNQMDMWVYFERKAKSAELRELLGLDPVSLVIKKVD